MAPTTTPTRMSAWLEQAWLIQYLDRRLAGEEAQWFEAYAMDRPWLLATIETDTRLRDALAAAASTRHTDMSVDGGGRPGGAADRDATGDVVGNAEPRESKSGPAAHGGAPSADSSDALPVIASPTRIIYDTMHDGTTLPRVEHADSHSAYVLVEIAVPLGAEQITLDIGDGAPQALARSPDGFVTFLADRNTLAAAANARVNYRAGGRTQMRPLHFNQKGV